MANATLSSDERTCGWWGEGRGPCILPAGHAFPHKCEQDQRLNHEREQKQREAVEILYGKRKS